MKRKGRSNSLLNRSQHSAADVKDDAEGRSLRSRSLSGSSPATKEPKMETVRIITKDLIRDLRQEGFLTLWIHVVILTDIVIYTELVMLV